MTKNNGRPLASPIQRISREEALPLSFAQQRLWFLDQLEPGSASQRQLGKLSALLNK